MSIKKMFAMTAALAVITISGNASAGITINPAIGYYNFDSDLNLDDESTASLGIGYQFSERWAAELVYLATDATSITGAAVDITQARLDALYHGDSSGNFQPYLVFGVGQNNYEQVANLETDNSLLNFGPGVKYWFNDSLSLRTDLRLIHEFDRNDNVPNTNRRSNSFLLNVGLHYVFGGRHTNSPKKQKPAAIAPAPAVVALDSDRDGVNDNTDKCPNTPRGISVNSSGCNNDSDRDGVLNSKDLCPNTSAGSKVDETGCYIVLKEKRVIELNVKFANASNAVPAEYYSEIEAIAQFMREFPLTNVVIEGHTDDRGAAAFNQRLSEQRAAAVAKVLVDTYKVDASRVSSVGHGEEKPLVNNNTAENRAKNRRVVGVVSAVKEKIVK